MLDIWPKNKLRFNFFNKNNIEDIERKINEIFTNTYPVLFSSGRSAIVNCLKATNLKREDIVACSPFANACIFRTVGEVSTPAPANLKFIPNAQLIYHQWGYVQKTNITNNVIEDSIDSIVINSNGLFPNHGNFEIISLSKIFGLPFGAIVFCKNEKLKNKILEIRNSNKKFVIYQNFTKFFSQFSSQVESYWNHLETLNGFPGNLISDLIYEKLEKYKSIIDDRKNKISILQKNIFYPLSKGRYPIIIPIKIKNKRTYKKIYLLNKFRHLERHINLSKNFRKWDLIKIFPLPIHQEVPIDLIYDIQKIISHEY
jgi:putative PLP-dependent aminotransferase (TIGR04422 family)